MPLTTVSEGRVYDWSHAVGRNAARGPGFNYVQTMCLGKDGVLYATNRGNENNFGMHVNKTKLGAPGEEEWLADFCEHGDGDSHCTWPFGVAVDDQDHVYLSDDWRNTVTSSSSTAATIGCRSSLRTASLSVNAAGPGMATASSTSPGGSLSTRTAISTSPTGTTIGSKSSLRRVSS